MSLIILTEVTSRGNSYFDAQELIPKGLNNNRHRSPNMLFVAKKLYPELPAGASVTRSRCAATRELTSLYNEIINRMKTAHESLCFGPRFRLVPDLE